MAFGTCPGICPGVDEPTTMNLKNVPLKNVPGFTDEVVDTFLRKVAKVQGDLTLIEETRLKPQ